jgi:hypothetical protein
VPPSESELDSEESTRRKFMGAFLNLLLTIVRSPSESDIASEKQPQQPKEPKDPKGSSKNSDFS